jgi:hypothetical protein
MLLNRLASCRDADATQQRDQAVKGKEPGVAGAGEQLGAKVSASWELHRATARDSKHVMLLVAPAATLSSHHTQLQTQNTPQPAPPATTPNEQCGVSLSFLSWFGDYVDPNMSTREVVEHVSEAKHRGSNTAMLPWLHYRHV